MERRLFISRPRLRGMTVLGALLLEVSAALAEVGWKCNAIDPADALVHRTGADGVKLGDLNGDGRPDLVTGWEEGGQVRVCLHPGLETVKEPSPAITIGSKSAGASLTWIRNPGGATARDLSKWEITIEPEF